MLKYIARRALYMVIMMALVFVFAFVLINLLHGQYLTWMRGIVLRGDFGHSFQFNRPIGELIAVRLPFSVVLSSATLLFTFAMAIPIGIYVATHQYSVGDYSATVFGFLGLATPNFLLALVLMLVDLLGHLIVPVVVIGTAGTSRWCPKRRGATRCCPSVGPLDGVPEVPVLIEPGDLLCFSGAHLHASRPNRTGRTRLSIDTRIVEGGDLRAGKGPANVDGHAPRTVHEWFRNVSGEPLAPP